MAGQIGMADATVHTRRGSYTKSSPQPIGDLLKKDFDPANMDPDLKRGMVLYIYRSKIKEVLPKEQLGLCLADLVSAWMPEDGAKQTVLFIRFKPSSMWKVEMQAYRHRIKWLINTRLKSDFLKDVRIC